MTTIYWNWIAPLGLIATVIIFGLAIITKIVGI